MHLSDMTTRLLAVVLDRAHARFFEVTESATVELPCLASPAMRGGRFHSDRQDAPGWGERDYHGRIREEARRHYDAVIHRVEALQRRHPTAGVFLAGPGRTAAELRHRLPPRIAERVVGTAKLNPTEVTPAVVRRTATALERRHEGDEDRRLVAALQEGLGTGHAENGMRAVLRALAGGQVQTLLVRPGVWDTGFRCANSGRLVVSAEDCRGEGDPVRVPDIVAEAMEDARRRGATVVLIRDPEAGRAIDGMAALLRFASGAGGAR